MHCSANVNPQDENDVALFFGLSGTGKTTLSADPTRRLIGDDEHGWSDEGVFNFEGGCYAKVIGLSEFAEPEIYATTHMYGTILENVTYDPVTRLIDLDDELVTENTRASYPLEFISNAVPEKKAGHPKNVIMLTCDASGVMPPIARLSFKVPTEEELDHDYLWRVHKVTPRKGEIVIFNRSHYEDVLVVRVHDLVPPEVWRKRFDQINQFERLLAENGTTILKFYLHIDLDEQKERLQARLDEPDKRWKFSLGDLDERKLWPAYMQAYEDVLSKTSTKYAPWYIIPANRKWYRDLVISSVLVDTLEGLKMKYPEPEEKLDGIVVE